jgi:hypothetical protein
LWKAASTASIMIFAFAFLKGMQAPWARPQPGGMPPQVLGALTRAGRYLLSGLTTWSLVLALGRGEPGSTRTCIARAQQPLAAA